MAGRSGGAGEGHNQDQEDESRAQRPTRCRLSEVFVESVTDGRWGSEVVE